MKVPHAFAMCLALSAAACGGGKPRPAADSTAMSDTAAKSVITLSAEQIRHGGIEWAPAAAGTIASSTTLPGQVVPNEDRTARLGAPAGGRVVDVRVRAGDRVRQGQVLVTLQSPEAAMAQSELAKATAELTSRRAQASYARAARERADRLLALKSMPQQDHDRAVTEDEQAQASVTQAEAELARAQSTAAQLGAGAVSGQMLIRAPFSGVVLERSGVPGTVVEAGAALVVVTNPASLWLTIDAPENLAGGFRIGGRLLFTVPAFPTDTFTARIEGVAAGLDPATRTLAVRGLIANSAGKLKPEMLASVTASGAGRVSGVLLPDDAVVMIDGKPTVFIVMPMGSSTMFTRREVRTGSRSGGQVAITTGLVPGDVVVTRGAFAIKAELAKGSMPAMEM